MRSIISTVITFALLISCHPKKVTSVHDHGDVTISKAMTDSVVMLTDSQIRLANITTQKVMMSQIGNTVTLNARLVTNENESQVISSRVSGRIEKLFLKETGKSIRKGEPLYTLYSESLLTLQNEYLLAKEQYEVIGKKETRYRSYVESAKKKLRLYGLSEKQITQLAESKSVLPAITFLSPCDGTATEINVAEGQYVTEGSLLYRIEDVRELWIEAEVYPQEKALIKTGDVITARIGSDEVQAKVIFMSPEYTINSQITLLRAAIANNELKWKSGMQALVFLTHSSHQAISVPTEGVIRNASGAQVFVLSDKNTFQSRKVKTGLENFSQIEITEGIKEGETIVTSGAYLLHSELILNH
ncbi:MAG: efflux RND transporter periplasmic adaptor subunit [Azospira oryzae]|jgi:Cu(I)/Ag(I) efflux system membrane fusion protein|nr:MAG: efflux RND transporter periplasmic adaptor subunit [Azospira oryzae]